MSAHELLYYYLDVDTIKAYILPSAWHSKCRILFFLMRTAFGGSLLTLGSFLADFGSSQLILGDRSISLGVAHVDVREFLHRRWEFLH